MARSVAKSCDAGRTPPGPPTPAQERAQALFTLSGFQNEASFSHRPERQQQHQQSERAEWKMLAVGTAPSAPAGTFLPDLWFQPSEEALNGEKSSGCSFLPFIV